MHNHVRGNVKFDGVNSRLTIAVSLLTMILSPAAGQSQSASAHRALRLEDVLATTAQHPLVAAARARFDAARGSRKTAGAFPNPVASYQVENAPFPGQRSSADLTRETAATVTLPLETIYQRGSRVRLADEEARAAESEILTVRRTVALNAARAFYRVALAEIALRGARENHDGLTHLATYNEKRVREGLTPEGELLRVRLERDRASTQTVFAQIEVARARAEIRAYLPLAARQSADDSISVDIQGAFPAARVPAIASLVSYATRCRPELVTARARVAAASAETSIQRALTIRQVGATFGQKRVGSETSMIAGVSVPIPLFDRNRGEIQRATANRIAAERELEWTERSITAELTGALNAVTMVAAEVARLGSSFLDRAEEIRRISLAAYEEGAASLLQVLDASRALNEARLGFYQALFQEKQSVLELAVAAGFEPGLSLTNASETAACAARNAGIGANP